MPSLPCLGSNIPRYVASISEFSPHTTRTLAVHAGPLLSGNAILAGFRLFFHWDSSLWAYFLHFIWALDLHAGLMTPLLLCPVPILPCFPNQFCTKLSKKKRERKGKRSLESFITSYFLLYLTPNLLTNHVGTIFMIYPKYNHLLPLLLWSKITAYFLWMIS